MFGSQPQLKNSVREQRGQAFSSTRMQTGKNPYEQASGFTQNQMGGSFGSNFNHGFIDMSTKTMYNAAARAHSSLGISHAQAAQNLPTDMSQSFHNQLRLSQNLNSDQMLQMQGMAAQHQAFSSSMGLPGHNMDISQINDVFTTNPTLLLHQHNQCKADNKERLKQVRNLEDLINFKVTTIADHVQEQKEQLYEQKFQTKMSELSSFNVVQKQSDTSIIALKKMCDPLLTNGYYPKLLSKKGLESQTSEEKYQIPSSWLELKPNYNQTRIPKHKKKLDKIVSTKSKQPSSVKDADNQKEEVDKKTLENSKKKEERPDSNESYYRNKDKFFRDQENLRIQSEKIKKEHDESVREQEERINKQRADKQIDPVKLLKDFFNNRAQTQQSAKKQRAKTEMSQHESQASFKNQSTLKPSGSVHPNFVVAKYRKMKETGKLDKLERQIQERQSQIDLQHQYEHYQYLQNLSAYLAQKEAMESNILKSQTQIKELEQMQEFNPVTTNLNPDSRQGSADIIVTNGGAPQQISNNASNNNFRINQKYQNEPHHMFTDENDQHARKDNISKMRSELRQIFNEDEASNEAALKAQKSKPTSEITPSVMSPTALLERVDQLIDPQSHKTRLNTQHTNGNISNDQMNIPVTDNKVGSGVSNFMSFQRSSLASVGLGIRETEPVIVAPRDAVTHERVVRVVKNHQTFAPKRQYGQKVGKLFTDMSQQDEKQSFVRHSELTKYQSVKTSGTTKSYVSYTDEQIKLAQRLKSMEQNQQKSLREQQQLAADNYSSQRDQIDPLEAEKKRQLKMQKIHEQHHASIGAISIDLRGSLPKIKHELEKKTEKSSVFGRKTYKEDEVEYSGMLHTNENEYSSVTPVQISDYGMGPGTAMVSKQRTQNNFNSKAQKGKSQQFQRNARVTFHNKKPHLMDASDPNSPEINGKNIHLIPRGLEVMPQEINQVPALPIQKQNKGDDYDEVNLADPQFRAAAVQAQSSSDREHSKDKTETQEFTMNNSMGFVVNDIGSIQMQPQQDPSDYAQTKPMIDLQKVDPESVRRDEDQDTVKHRQDSVLTTPITNNNLFGPDTNIGPTKVVSVLKSTDGVHESTIKMPQVEERSSERIDTEIDAIKIQDPYGVQMNKNMDSAQNLSVTSQSQTPQPLLTKTPEQNKLKVENIEVENTHGQASKTQGFALPSGRQDRVAIFSNQQSKPNLKNQGKDTQKNSLDQKSMLISDVPIEEKEMTSDVIIRITKEEKTSSNTIEESKNQSLKNLEVVGESQKLSQHPLSKQRSRDQGSKQSLRAQINQDIVKESGESKSNDRFYVKKKPSIPHLQIDSNIQDSGLQSSMLTGANQQAPLKLKDTMNAQFRRKKPTKDEYDKGYHSSNEPQMDQVSAELYDQIINDHLVRRGCWIPQRFKKFPRFTIFTQKEGTDDKNHLQNQFISLNPQVLALLAASDVTNIGQISTVLEEPAVTNRSKLVPNQESSQSPHREVKLGTVIGKNYQAHQIDDLVQNTGNESNRTIKKEETQNTPQQKILKSRLGSSKQYNFGGKNSQNRRSSQKASSQEPIDIMNDLLGPDRDSHAKQKEHVEVPQTMIKQFDPFDKVLLTKGIDNQILTSFRTLSKDNNMISNTLKVVHQRFFGQGANKALLSKVPKSKILYPLNKDIYDPEDHQSTLDNMTDQQKRDYASYLVLLSQIGAQSDGEISQVHMLPENSSTQVFADIQRQVQIQGSDPLASMTSHASDPPKLRAQGLNNSSDAQPTMNIIPSEQLMSAEQSNTFRINTNRTPNKLNDQSKAEPDFNQDGDLGQVLPDNQKIKIDQMNLNLKHSEKSAYQKPSKHQKKPQRTTLAMGKVNVNQGQAYNADKSPYMVDGKQIKASEKSEEAQNRGLKRFHVKGSLPQVHNMAGRNVMQNSIIESRSGGGTRRGTSFSPDRKGTIQANQVYENLPVESREGTVVIQPNVTVQEVPDQANVIDSDYVNRKESEFGKMEEDSKASVRVSENFKHGINTGGTTTQYGTLNEDKKTNAKRQSNQDKQIKIVKLNAPDSLRQSKNSKKNEAQDSNKNMPEQEKLQTASLESIEKNNVMTLGTHNANISRQEEYFYSSQKGKGQLPHMQVEVVTNSSRGPSPTKDFQNSLAIRGNSHMMSPKQRQERKGLNETTQNMKQDQLRKTTNKFSGGFQKPKSKAITQNTDKTVTPHNKSDKQDMQIQEINTIDQQERDALLRKTDMVKVLSQLTQQAHGSSLEELQRILIDTQKRAQKEEDKKQSLKNINKDLNNESNNHSNKNQGNTQTFYNNQNTEKHQIKKMIDEIYSREKKYQKKQVDRDDLLQTNDMIFDLSKAHELNSMNIQQTKPVVSESRHFKHPYIWNRPQVIAQKGPAGVKQRIEKNLKQHSVSPSQAKNEIKQPETLHNSPQISSSSVPRAKDQNLQLVIEGQTPADNSDWVTPSQLKAITSALKTSERQAISHNKNIKKIALNDQGAQSTDRAEVAVGSVEQGGDYADPVTQRASLVSRDAEVQGRNRMISGASNRLGTGNSTHDQKSPKNSQGEKFEEFVNGVHIQVNQKN